MMLRREAPTARRLAALLGAGVALTLITACAALIVNRALDADLGVLITRPLRLSIDAAPEARAGDIVTVTVQGAPSGAAVSLLTIGSVGAVNTDAVAHRDGAVFDLSTETTRWAGVVTLIARSGNSVASRTLRLVPGPVIAPVPAGVGPRSITADGADTAMLVTTPTDRFGNAATDGTVVDMVHGLPGGGERHTELKMSGLLAYGLLRSGTTAATGVVRVGVGEVSGPTVSLDEVAGPPVRFTLQAVGKAPDADGRSLLRVRTSVLRDRYGNEQPNGTEVTLRWSDPAGRNVADAYTVRGVAEFTIEAPREPATLTLEASCRGVATARPLKVEFRTVRPVIPLTAQRRQNGVSIEIGPVRAGLGALIADGTPVSVAVLDPQNHRYERTGQLVNGMLRLTVPTDELSGVLTVQAKIFGTTERTTLR
jgi:hypothetical protein